MTAETHAYIQQGRSNVCVCGLVRSNPIHGELRCITCGDPIDIGPGGWFSLASTLEVCGEDPTGYHTPPAPPSSMEGADLSAELERLRGWQDSAMRVLAGWDRVHEALGCPGPLGASKAVASLAEVERLVAAVEGSEGA